MKNAHQLVFLVLGALAVGACDDPPALFDHCPLSSSIIRLCEEESSDTDLTCIVREHPMCTEHVCAAWEGSDSFCSRVCSGDGDCTAESTCKSYLDFSVCVPNELPPPRETTAQ